MFAMVDVGIDFRVQLFGVTIILYFLNGSGQGKGIAIYHNLDDVEYQHVCNHPVEMSKLSAVKYECMIFFSSTDHPQVH
jgi:hypothetical protein